MFRRASFTRLRWCLERRGGWLRLGFGIQDEADEGGSGGGVFRRPGLDAAGTVSVEHEQHEGVIPVAFEEFLVGVLFREVGAFDFGSLGDPLFHHALGGMGCE